MRIVVLWALKAQGLREGPPYLSLDHCIVNPTLRGTSFLGNYHVCCMMKTLSSSSLQRKPATQNCLGPGSRGASAAEMLTPSRRGYLTPQFPSCPAQLLATTGQISRGQALDSPLRWLPFLPAFSLLVLSPAGAASSKRHPRPVPGRRLRKVRWVWYCSQTTGPELPRAAK